MSDNKTLLELREELKALMKPIKDGASSQIVHIRLLNILINLTERIEKLEQSNNGEVAPVKPIPNNIKDDLESIKFAFEAVTHTVNDLMSKIGSKGCNCKSKKKPITEEDAIRNKMARNKEYIIITDCSDNNYIIPKDRNDDFIKWDETMNSDQYFTSIFPEYAWEVNDIEDLCFTLPPEELKKWSK